MDEVHVIPGEISTFTIAVAILSGFIVFFGYVSMFIKEKCFLSEAFVALIVGIIAGPLVANGFNPASWSDFDEVTKELTRCILAIQVMAVGIELPKHYMKKEWLTMFMLLLPTMLFMWLISGLFIWWMIPPINYLHALVIAACVCPTDPILANSVVKGRFAEKHVPAHIRNALSAESGANDGMGFPFLFLALFLISENSVGTAIGKWIYITLLFQIALSCVIGLVVGYVARKLLQWSERHHLIDKPSFLCFAIALALFLMSMTGFSGSDDLLACFVAGNAFSWDDWFRQETEEAHFQDVIDMMLNLAVFVYIGAIIPWSEFGNADIGLVPWKLVVMAILILLFRRLPILILLKPVMPALKTYREAIFSGWFGPMGVGAVFLSMIAKEELEEIYHDVEEKPVTIQLVGPVVLFIVLSSTLVHGTTIPLFKIGKRIRTRTLSIASTSSNQIRRLPKLQFRKSFDDTSKDQKEKSEAMLQLERNTIANTIPKKQQENDISQHSSNTFAIDINDSDDDLKEEDFLPDESDGVYNTSTPVIVEPQSIRFVEPVNPRASMYGNQLQVPRRQSVDSSNIEKNETSVSSFKSWLRNNKTDDDVDVETSTSQNNNNNNGGGGIRNLLKKYTLPPPQNSKDINHSSAIDTLKNILSSLSEEETIDLDGIHLSPRIEIWDEPNHILIEDKQNVSTNYVIDKDQSNWELSVKEKVRQVQSKIEQEEEEEEEESVHYKP